LIVRLRPEAKIRWSRVENLHITTKFIGEWEESRLGELAEALESIPFENSISIRVSGIGWFPQPHSPRILWAAVRGEGLPELAAATGRACATLGIPTEERPYTPHLTLARIEPRGGGPPPDLAPLRRAIASLPGVDFGSFEASGFHLYRRDPVGGESRYTKLSSHPIKSLRQK